MRGLGQPDPVLRDLLNPCGRDTIIVAMTIRRMNREQFFGQLATLDEQRLKKALWNLYWRGSAATRERIEAEIDPDQHDRGKRPSKEPADPQQLLGEVGDFVALARSGAYMAGDRRVSPGERTRWRCCGAHCKPDTGLLTSRNVRRRSSSGGSPATAGHAAGGVGLARRNSRWPACSRRCWRPPTCGLGSPTATLTRSTASPAMMRPHRATSGEPRAKTVTDVPRRWPNGTTSCLTGSSAPRPKIASTG